MGHHGQPGGLNRDRRQFSGHVSERDHVIHSSRGSETIGAKKALGYIESFQGETEEQDLKSGTFASKEGGLRETTQKTQQGL